MKFNNQQLKKIGNLKLFGNIELKLLQTILKYAQIKTYQRNDFLFLRGEKMSNIYILLEGSIKLSFVDNQGIESIFQIINHQTTLNNIFSNIFLTNAEAIKKSEILIIPIFEIKKFININLQLALNFINELNLQNQQIINYTEQLKISDTKQKLGQFLLGMAFQKGVKTNEINLEFNKSEIASYLGMQPETLSRTLKKLENDGEINIRKNTIILTKPNSLCKYCNYEIANKCQNFKPSLPEIGDNICQHLTN